MKKIYFLEYFNFSEKQLERLNALGEVKMFDAATEKDIKEAEKKADVLVVDWLDPTDIITKMKKKSFVCLPFTGYGWITTLKEAMDKGVTFSNTPNYSTNAVAEHHLALMLACAKNVAQCDAGLKKGDVPTNKNIELSGKTVGIIGLGHIGFRLAELLKAFNVKILTTNSSYKNAEGIKDVKLETLLKQSDFVCVTCALNEQTKNMLAEKQLKMMKKDAILTATTGGVIDLIALEKLLGKGKLFGVGLEEFMDVNDVPERLINHPKVTCTFHRAYNTVEAEENRLNMCIDNIEAFLKGKPINLIKF